MAGTIRDLSVGDISSMLRSNADAIARSLLPGGRYESGGTEWRCTGTNSPTGTTICVHVGHGNKQGVCGFWNETPAGGDLLDLYQLVTGCSPRKSIEWAKEWLGIDDAPATRRNLRDLSADKRRREDFSRYDKQRASIAAKIWKSAGPLKAEGAVYLTKRGIDAVYAGTELRLIQFLSHPSGGTFPAIIARVSDENGKGVGIWRIYLKPTGDGKAPVENPKLGLGRCIEGAVRIGGIWTEIGIAEGIETALACRQLVHKATGVMMPVWAALSTAGMKAVKLPPDIMSVRIYADNDPIKFRNGTIKLSSGMTAASELADRLRAEGRKVRIEEPPVGFDWLDVLNSVQKGQLAAITSLAA